MKVHNLAAFAVVLLSVSGVSYSTEPPMKLEDFVKNQKPEDWVKVRCVSDDGRYKSTRLLPLISYGAIEATEEGDSLPCTEEAYVDDFTIRVTRRCQNEYERTYSLFQVERDTGSYRDYFHQLDLYSDPNKEFENEKVGNCEKATEVERKF